MKGHGWRRWSVLFLALLLSLTGGWVLAQEKFPTRDINLVIAFAPGGNIEMNAQFLRPMIQKILGVNAVLVMKPGGDTTIGAHYAANAPADGYTLMPHTASLFCTQYTTKAGVSYKRFDPVIRTTAMPYGICVGTESPFKTLKQLIDHAKANPGKMVIGNSGTGAMNHIAWLGIEMILGVKFAHMPFKGSGPYMTALVGGHIDAAMSDLNSLYPFIEAKKIRMLAVSSPERNSLLPDVPTFEENGFELNVGSWSVFFVPKGTPKERIQILHNAFKEAMNTKEYQEFYKKQGTDISYMDMITLATWLDKQHDLWKGIIDFAKFKPVD
jgi:tripartite-type tricarboxylate transporter receptor subunit TctC